MPNPTEPFFQLLKKYGFAIRAKQPEPGTTLFARGVHKIRVRPVPGTQRVDWYYHDNLLCPASISQDFATVDGLENTLKGLE